MKALKKRPILKCGEVGVSGIFVLGQDSIPNDDSISCCLRQNSHTTCHVAAFRSEGIDK